MAKSIIETLKLQSSQLSTAVNTYVHTMSYDRKVALPVEKLTSAISETAITDTRGKTVFFTGIGKNKSIAKKTSDMFASLNFDARALCPVDAMHGDLGSVRESDVIVAISKSGNTAELIHFLRYVSTEFPNILVFGVQVGIHDSKFDEYCDYVVKLPQIAETNELNAPTNSIILSQLFLDAVATSIISITKDEFSRTHPGGTLGNGRDKK